MGYAACTEAHGKRERRRDEMTEPAAAVKQLEEIERKKDYKEEE